MIRRASIAACIVLLVGAAAAACGSGKAGLTSSDGGSDGSFLSDGPSGSDGMLSRDGGDAGTGGGDASSDATGRPPGCDPSCVAAGGQCSVNTCVISENPGGVSMGTQVELQAGGTSDSQFAWLYPYDATVFPRGLVTPTMQFGGDDPDAAWVHIASDYLTYNGFYGASSPGRIALSQAVWEAVTLAASGSDTVKVQVTKISGGNVTGPISETWTIAPGGVHGTIYYETYYSSIIADVDDAGGGIGIMHLKPGDAQPTPLKIGCGNVCHSASADGSTLAAAISQYSSSAAYDLKNNAAIIWAQPNQSYTYGTLYPDGSLLMSATGYRLWSATGEPPALYDTATGATIAAAGWDGVITNAPTAAFSPDGTHLAFNHWDTGMGHSLGVVPFDVNSKSFSAVVDVAQDPNLFLGWPAFTPDSQSIVYQAGPQSAEGSIYQFETDNYIAYTVDLLEDAGTNESMYNAKSDLYHVDLATKTVVRLDSLDGYSASGSYLPANDPNYNFAPTMLPLQVGGYYWVVFTSHRSYGNTLASLDAYDIDGKLWVAAIDPSAPAGVDPSHPAFYLDGQELGSDNLRGFWVLDPCAQNGTSCGSGDQCCSGFCRGASGSTVCIAPPTVTADSGSTCSNEFEKCSSASNCCNPTNVCVNNFCADRAQ